MQAGGEFDLHSFSPVQWLLLGKYKIKLFGAHLTKWIYLRILPPPPSQKQSMLGWTVNTNYWTVNTKSFCCWLVHWFLLLLPDGRGQSIKTLYPAINSALGNNFPVTPGDRNVGQTWMFGDRIKVRHLFYTCQSGSHSDECSHSSMKSRALRVPKLLLYGINMHSFAEEAEWHPSTLDPNTSFPFLLQGLFSL